MEGSNHKPVADRGGPALTYQIMICPARGTRGHALSLDLYSDGYFGSSGLSGSHAGNSGFVERIRGVIEIEAFAGVVDSS